MLRRIFINASSKRKEFFIINRKQNISYSSLNREVSGNQRLSAVSPLQITCVQARFCSSNTSGTILHKVFFVNAESPPPADNISLTESVQYIPPPPLPPEITAESLTVLNKLGEPTFESLGLAGWSPIGLIQSSIEFFHVTGGLPWWGSIALATVIMRTCLFPLVVVAQRNAALMNNHMPTIQHLQVKTTEARNSGNNLEAAKLAYEMQEYMKTSGINPIRSMFVPLAQAPIFISMFLGLRRCANLPVESMKDGGMFWFTDLTIADPFFALPVVTSLTMLATIELGAEGQKVSNQNSKILRYVLRAMPLLIFPFTLHFPAAVLCYWVSTNFCSLMQVGFLKIPRVRNYFKIDPIIKHGPGALPADKKGVIQGMKESWSNMQIASEIDERQRIDEVKFKRAGSGPLVKTFKHNPLKRNVIDVKAKVKSR